MRWTPCFAITIPAVNSSSSACKSGWVQQLRGLDDGPAQVFTHPDSRGGGGSSCPYSRTCAGCNRLRVPRGQAAPVPLWRQRGGTADLLTADDQQEALQWRIRQALTGKAAAHRLHDGNAGMTPTWPPSAADSRRAPK